jgi:hypothetical protein
MIDVSRKIALVGCGDLLFVTGTKEESKPP